MKTLKLVFQSLLNNGAVMEGRKQPWWVALILFFLSVIFATYPTFTQINARVGSAFLGGNTYSLEYGLTEFSETLVSANIDLEVQADLINGEEKLSLKNNGTLWQNHFTNQFPSTNFSYFQYAVNESPRLRVYYQADQSDQTLADFISQLLALELGNTHLSSFMMLGRSAIYVYVYNPAAIVAKTVAGDGYITSFTGTYDSVPVNTNLGEFISRDALGGYVDPATKNNNITAYVERIFNNWKTFFDQSFAYPKSVLLIAQTTLTLGVNMLMSLMMMLVIFLMTRGKMNPNRTMKFGETMKIGAWALLSPALLTIVAGALFPEFAATAFVLFVGLRLMWLSSKYLRPIPTTPVVTPKK